MSEAECKTKPPIEIPVLIGPRVSLQPLTENDLPAFDRLRQNDERTRQWARQTFPQPFENQKKMILEADFSTKAKEPALCGLAERRETSNRHRRFKWYQLGQ